MVLLLSGLGIALGIATAFAIHNLFGRLRQRATGQVAIIGWILAAVTTFFGALLTRAHFVMRSDPHASMGPAWGFIALMLFLLLAVCGLAGVLHSHKYKLPWSRSFGVLMAESGAAFLAAVLLNMLYYPVADILQGGNRAVPEIYASYEQARHILGLATYTLMGALLALEVMRPLISRRSVLSIPPLSNPE